MRDREQSVLNEILPPEERAIEAVVARYQRVAPAVTRFARSLSGNEDLQVRLGTQAASTENTIVLDPGVFATAYARSAPVTPSEVALTSALHEVIHLIATDFDEERPIPKEWHAFRPESPEDEGDLEEAMVPVGLSSSERWTKTSFGQTSRRTTSTSTRKQRQPPAEFLFWTRYMPLGDQRLRRCSSR